MKKYGFKIREIREKNNDTREELAKKLKISESALGKYERGERNIKPILLEKVAEIYDVPFSSLFGDEVDMPRELKELGVEWITFAKEMNEKNLTPEEIKATLELLEKLGIKR